MWTMDCDFKYGMITNTAQYIVLFAFAVQWCSLFIVFRSWIVWTFISLEFALQLLISKIPVRKFNLIFYCTFISIGNFYSIRFFEAKNGSMFRKIRYKLMTFPTLFFFF